jgi:hypothetical protein
LLSPVSLCWWDGRMDLVLPLVSQDVGTSHLASVLWCPPSSASSVAGVGGYPKNSEYDPNASKSSQHVQAQS